MFSILIKTVGFNHDKTTNSSSSLVMVKNANGEREKTCFKLTETLNLFNNS